MKQGADDKYDGAKQSIGDKAQDAQNWGGGVKDSVGNYGDSIGNAYQQGKDRN